MCRNQVWAKSFVDVARSACVGGVVRIEFVGGVVCSACGGDAVACSARLAEAMHGCVLIRLYERLSLDLLRLRARRLTFKCAGIKFGRRASSTSRAASASAVSCASSSLGASCAARAAATRWLAVLVSRMRCTAVCRDACVRGSRWTCCAFARDFSLLHVQESSSQVERSRCVRRHKTVRHRRSMSRSLRHGRRECRLSAFRSAMSPGSAGESADSPMAPAPSLALRALRASARVPAKRGTARVHCAG